MKKSTCAKLAVAFSMMFLIVMGYLRTWSGKRSNDSLDGCVLLSNAEREKIFEGLFPPVSPEQETFAEQYVNDYLVDKTIANISENSEVIIVAQDDCDGRRVWAFYPEDIVTIYFRLYSDYGDDRIVYDMVTLDAEEIKRLQIGLKDLNFFNISSNLINLKKYLTDNVTVIENGKPITTTREIKPDQDGITLSLKVTHPYSKVYHTVHVLEPYLMMKQYPTIKEYDVFDKCIQLIMSYIPQDKRFKKPLSTENSTNALY